MISFCKAFTFYQKAHDVCAFSNMDKQTNNILIIEMSLMSLSEGQGSKIEQNKFLSCSPLIFLTYVTIWFLVVHHYLCQFYFYLFINIDKTHMKRNMFLVNLPFHIMEVRREKPMIFIKGRSEVGRLGRGKYELQVQTDNFLFLVEGLIHGA